MSEYPAFAPHHPILLLPCFLVRMYRVDVAAYHCYFDSVRTEVRSYPGDVLLISFLPGSGGWNDLLQRELDE